MAELNFGRSQLNTRNLVGTSTGFSEQLNISKFFHVFCVFISAISIIADLSTDILVFTEYWRRSYLYWALLTLLLFFLPLIVTHIFSLRWLTMEKKIHITDWVSHVCLIGIFQRYLLYLHDVTKNPENKDQVEIKKLIERRSELTMLHLFHSYVGSAPQILFQSYSMIILNETYNVRGISSVISLWSLMWAGLLYTHTTIQVIHFHWAPYIAKSLWFVCMLLARLAAIFLFSTVFSVWTFVPLGIHWAAMTFWIISQKTTFCPTKTYEILYNVTMGFIYCFSYFNLRNGQSKYTLLTFYTLIVTQNMASLFLFVLISDLFTQRKYYSIFATTCVVAGTVIGLCSMLLYYQRFHWKGPLKWKNIEDNDIELNNKESNVTQNKKTCNDIKVGAAKTLKTLSESRKLQSERNSQETTPSIEVETADKKKLLEHFIGRSGTPTFISAPVGDNNIDLSGIEIFSNINTPNTVFNATQGSFRHIKTKKVKKKICSPSKINLKANSYENLESSVEELTASNLTLQKRRGICSSDELKDDLKELDQKDDILSKSEKTTHSSENSQDTDSSNKKTSSDSIDMDLDLTLSDINSSDINEFNENIVQKLCLSTLKNIKVGNEDADIENIQRIALDILKEMYNKKGRSKDGKTDILAKRDLDTPTEQLSVHDYENICAVNIAREAWGLRSWNGYSDIENWRHDGSVFRDRRRDTLTSGSSEISSCVSQDLKHSILNAPAIPKRTHTYSNVIVKYDKEDFSNASGKGNFTIKEVQNDEDMFLAKPCLIDNPNAINNQLEPILEELDDFGDIETPISKPRLNSESSLVATIDEIRNVTITNSPNIYYRRENSWLSPQSDTSSKIETNLKKALWKEPSKFNFNNSLESLPEKENVMIEAGTMKSNVRRKPNPQVFLESNKSQPYNNKTRRRHKVNNLKPQVKKNNVVSDSSEFSNNKVDLWTLVNEPTLPKQLPKSLEDLSSSHINSSLQSLILRESQSDPNKANIKKVSRNKPRRKFSILRERFEPKTSKECENDLSTENFEKDNNKHLVRQINKTDVQTVENVSIRNLKEKRSIFLKQVLSPPKFNTKGRYKS